MQDPYPLPLYSNCWPQFILRAIFLAAMHWFVVSSFADTLLTLFAAVVLILVLLIRNLRVRHYKAEKKRKRLD
eukprot:g31121.t1